MAIAWGRGFVLLGLLVFPVLSGFSAVMASALNGETSRLLDSLIWSVAISTWMAFAVMLTIALFAPRPPFITNVKRAIVDTRVQPTLICMWFQSPLMVSFTLLGAWLPQHIGLGIFFVVVIFCQVVGSLIFDLTGFFWTVKRTVFWQGWLGGLLVLLGAILFQMRELTGKVDISGSFIGYLALAMCAGFCSILVPLQAVRMASYIGPFPGTAYAYGMGTTIMALLLLVTWTPPADGVQPADWWKFFGGVFGMSSMLLNVIFARKLGFAIHFSAVTAGQLFLSLMLDSIGFAGLDPVPISLSRVGGVLLVGCGVGLFGWNKIKSPKNEGLEPKSADEEDTGVGFDYDDKAAKSEIDKFNMSDEVDEWQLEQDLDDDDEIATIRVIPV